MMNFSVLVLTLGSAIIFSVAGYSSILPYYKLNQTCDSGYQSYKYGPVGNDSYMLIEMRKNCSFDLEVPPDNSNRYAQKIVFGVIGECAVVIKKAQRKEHCSLLTHGRSLQLEAHLRISRNITSDYISTEVPNLLIHPSEYFTITKSLHATMNRDFYIKFSPITDPAVYYLLIRVLPYEDDSNPFPRLVTPVPDYSTTEGLLNGHATIVTVGISMFVVLMFLLVVACRNKIQKRLCRTNSDRQDITENRGPVQLISMRNYSTNNSNEFREWISQEIPSWTELHRIQTAHQHASHDLYRSNEEESNSVSDQLPSYEAATQKPDETPPSYHSLYTHEQYRKTNVLAHLRPDGSSNPT